MNLSSQSVLKFIVGLFVISFLFLALFFFATKAQYILGVLGLTFGLISFAYLVYDNIRVAHKTDFNVSYVSILFLILFGTLCFVISFFATEAFTLSLALAFVALTSSSSVLYVLKLRK